jgi:hypothetical protein
MTSCGQWRWLRLVIAGAVVMEFLLDFKPA